MKVRKIKLGGRGSSSGVSSTQSTLDRANKPIDTSKTGASFNKLPTQAKQNIEKNLMLSTAFSGNIGKKKTNMTDEWTTGLKGKGKFKVETSYDGSTISYRVKQGNKILLKSTDKNQVANKVAEMYIKQGILK